MTAKTPGGDLVVPVWGGVCDGLSALVPGGSVEGESFIVTLFASDANKLRSSPGLAFPDFPYPYELVDIGTGDEKQTGNRLILIDPIIARNLRAIDDDDEPEEPNNGDST